MDYWGIARTHVVTQSVWGYFWNDMPKKFKKSFLIKLDKTAAKVNRCARRVKPSFKVKCLLGMFQKLHLSDKLWEIDNAYWKEQLKERGGRVS